MPFLALLIIATEKHPSASVKPVTKLGSNFCVPEGETTDFGLVAELMADVWCSLFFILLLDIRAVLRFIVEKRG